jgi:hypothetical protein
MRGPVNVGLRWVNVVRDDQIMTSSQSAKAVGHILRT